MKLAVFLVIAIATALIFLAAIVEIILNLGDNIVSFYEQKHEPRRLEND